MKINHISKFNKRFNYLVNVYILKCVQNVSCNSKVASDFTREGLINNESDIELLPAAYNTR